MSIYETQKALNEYLLFHYGTKSETNAPENLNAGLNFPERCVSELSQIKGNRALDLGCAVGRATFELTRYFDEVVGVDNSRIFIAAAQKIKSETNLEYLKLEVADEATPCHAILAPDIDREKVSFIEGSATALPASVGKFDFILMANLIDRLQDPLSCLESIPNLLNSKGRVAITSPFTWLEEFTPPKKWLTPEKLETLMSSKFKLIKKQSLPFLIREHKRKFQFSIALTFVWESKN